MPDCADPSLIYPIILAANGRSEFFCRAAGHDDRETEHGSSSTFVLLVSCVRVRILEFLGLFAYPASQRREQQDREAS
jgi:hypothetical protein